MKWMNPDGSDGGTQVYPDLLGSIGDMKVLPDSLYPSAAIALEAMKRRYLMAKYPYSVGVQTAVGDDMLHPGQIHSVSWDFDDGVIGVTGFVRDVDIIIENTTWKNTFRMILYREVY